MKKLLTIATGLLLLYVKTGAQDSQKMEEPLKTRIGVHAGGVASNFFFSSGDLTISNKSTFGFQGGMVLDLPIKRHLGIQTGLNFIQKGSKSDEDGYEWEMKTYGLELPVYVLYNSRGAKGNFFCGGGPSVSFFLNGNINEAGTKEDIKFGSDEMEDDLKQVDVGLGALAGYEFKSGLFLAVNTNIGVMNLVPGGGDDISINSFYIGLRVGYFFGNK